MRLILSFTMILTTSLVAGCADDVTTGGAGGGGTGGKGATSSSASSADGTSSTGQGGATVSSTTSSTGGGTGKACGECVEASNPFATGTSCGATIGACKNDASCSAWLDCTDECIKSDYAAACFSVCDAASAGSKSLQDPMYACVCAVCADPCGIVCE